MLTCKETARLISAQYDRPLALRERISMRLHLLMCRYCNAVARQISLIQRLIGARKDADLSSASEACLSRLAHDRIVRAIAKDSPSEGSNAPAG